MAGPINPVSFSWNHNGKNTDGSAFNPALFGGWELDLNGAPVVSVPIGWETDGTYQAPIASLNLPPASYTATLRLVTNQTPPTSSAPSNAIQFEIRAVPSAPLALSVD